MSTSTGWQDINDLTPSASEPAVVASQQEILKDSDDLAPVEATTAGSVIVVSPPPLVAEPPEPEHHRARDDADRFVVWWREASDAAVNGLYHPDPEVRRGVVRAMLPLAQNFPPGAPSGAPVAAAHDDGRAGRLAAAYGAKLELERQYVHTAVREALERIEQICAVCEREERHAKDALDALRESATRLGHRYGDPASREIIASQLLRAAAIITKEKDLRVQVARSQMRHARSVDAPPLDGVDAEIADAERACAPAFLSELFAMREAYRQSVINIDFEAAEMVRARCKDRWFGGLG